MQAGVHPRGNVPFQTSICFCSQECGVIRLPSSCHVVKEATGKSDHSLPAHILDVKKDANRDGTVHDAYPRLDLRTEYGGGSPVGNPSSFVNQLTWDHVKGSKSKELRRFGSVLYLSERAVTVLTKLPLRVHYETVNFKCSLCWPSDLS